MQGLLLLAGGVASLAAAATSQAAASLTAEQIVEKNVVARGGLTAWRAVQTLTETGQLDAGGKDNHQLPFVLKLERPHKSRMEVIFNGQTAVQVFDGTQGWTLRPFLNRNEVESLTKDQTKSAAASDEFDGPLIDLAAKGNKVALVGSDTVEGHAAYKLKLTGPAGVSRDVWIDTRSYLELKMDGEPRVLDGRPHAVSIYYRDYRSEHGLMIPHLLETAVEGVKVNHKLQITQVTINDKVDDALFQKPQPAAPSSGNSKGLPAAPAAPGVTAKKS